MPATSDPIYIRKGETFTQVIRWATTPRLYKPITAATKAGPCVLTVPSHGLPDGWRIDISAVTGMKELNTRALVSGVMTRTVFGRQFPNGIKATVTDANTLTLTEVNSALFTTYVSGGLIEYNTPVSLSGFLARMQIRDSVEATTSLFEFLTTNGRIALNDTTKTITLTALAADTAGITFTGGVASLEMESATGVVTLLIQNAPVVILETDVTR